MRRAMYAFSLAVTLSSLCWSFCRASTARPESLGLPPRLSQLTDLTPVLRRTDIGAVQKTAVLLLWLREERRQPTPTSRGLGGGDISSGYIQAQIVKALAEAGDPLALRQLITDNKTDASTRDAACLALGLMGDATQVSALMSIVDRPTEPYFRVTAAEALGCLAATTAIPALKRALDDNYAVTGGGCQPRGTSTVYPVRYAAEVALRVLSSDDPNLRSDVRERAARFESRLRAASKKALGKP